MNIITETVYVEMLRRMFRVRKYEESAINLYQAGQLRGSIHTCIGEEGAIVGACMALENNDYIVGTHRSHGHPIAKGADVKKLLAEICGKVTGVNRGKGGSMHMADFSVGCLGENSIVGTGIPIAIGAALGCKMQNYLNPSVCLCFFGDGAASEATFHESLNMASIWKLPVIFFCENNGYSVFNAVKDTVSVDDISSRAEYYKMPGIVVDGQNPVSCYEAVYEAAEMARRGKGPALIEAKTMRFHSHAESIPSNSKQSAQSEARNRIINFKGPEVPYFEKYREPIELFKALLIEKGIMTEQEITSLENEVDEELKEAVKYALESPFPDAEEAYQQIFV